jgi:hypothetical protein
MGHAPPASTCMSSIETSAHNIQHLSDNAKPQMLCGLCTVSEGRAQYVLCHLKQSALLDYRFHVYLLLGQIFVNLCGFSDVALAPSTFEERAPSLFPTC